MEVTGEVQVYILHGYNLCVAAAGCSALYAEDRSQGRLTKSYHNLLAKLLKSVRKAYRSRSLSLAGRGGVDSGYKNQLSIRLIRLF